MKRASRRDRRHGIRSRDELLSFATLPRSAALARLLNRRAGHVAVRTEDAAVAGQGFKHCSAMLAVVEILAGVGRHRLGRNAAALGAGEGGAQLGHRPSSQSRSGASNHSFHTADRITNAVAALSSQRVLFTRMPPLRRYSAQPSATARPDAIVSGQCQGTIVASPPAPRPARASAAGMTQQAV